MEHARQASDDRAGQHRDEERRDEGDERREDRPKDEEQQHEDEEHREQLGVGRVRVVLARLGYRRGDRTGRVHRKASRRMTRGDDAVDGVHQRLRARVGELRSTREHLDLLRLSGGRDRAHRHGQHPRHVSHLMDETRHVRRIGARERRGRPIDDDDDERLVDVLDAIGERRSTQRGRLGWEEVLEVVLHHRTERWQQRHRRDEGGDPRDHDEPPELDHPVAQGIKEATHAVLPSSWPNGSKLCASDPTARAIHMFRHGIVECTLATRRAYPSSPTLFRFSNHSLVDLGRSRRQGRASLADRNP